MSREGCAECIPSNAFSGKCEKCGRAWGDQALEGVGVNSPCSKGGMRGHAWRQMDPLQESTKDLVRPDHLFHFLEEDEQRAKSGPDQCLALIVCTYCKQRQASGTAMQYNTQATLLETLQAGFLLLTQQYNHMGQQLVFLAETLSELVEEEDEKEDDENDYNEIGRALCRLKEAECVFTIGTCRSGLCVEIPMEANDDHLLIGDGNRVAYSGLDGGIAAMLNKAADAIETLKDAQ